MAQIAELTVRIGADTKALSDGVKTAQNTVKEIGPKVQQAFGPQNQQAIQGTTVAVTNFNRIVQDSPYGIIGVANNLEPMIQSFNSLKAQTGSTTKALKTLLVSAFTGPGALITAVSLASTALVVFSQRMQKSGGASAKAKAGVESFNQALKEQIGLITDVRYDETISGRIKSAEFELQVQKELVAELTKVQDVAGEASLKGLVMTGNLSSAGIQLINQLFGSTIGQAERLKIVGDLINNSLQEQIKLEGTILGLKTLQRTESNKALDAEIDATDELIDRAGEITAVPSLFNVDEAKLFEGNIRAVTTAYAGMNAGQVSVALSQDAVNMRIREAIVASGEFVSGLSGGLANMIVQGEKLNDIMDNLKKILLSQGLQFAIKALLTGGIGAGAGFFGSGGGLFGSIAGLFGASTAFSPSTPALTGQNINVGGSFILRGQDLVLAMNRTQDFITR